MSRAELDLAVEWAAAEGWNPGLHDADCFHAADPEGFLVGLVDGTPVASISVVAYDDAFGFLGFYIVRPGERGRGHGIDLWRAGMERLGRRTVGLDGVVAQQANYAKSGFRLAYRNIRFGGPIREKAPARGCVKLAGIPFDRMVADDRRCFPAPRPAFLSLWTSPRAGAALGVVEDGRLAGWGVVRRCREGAKIGPLYAGSRSAAERLFAALAAEAPQGEPIFLDVPEPNRAALDLAERHGLDPVFDTARMYRGPAPAVDMARLYGVASFELG